jgi:epoxyqueuosine reductase
MAYMEQNAARRLDPGKVLEGVRSVVSLAVNYYHPYELPYTQKDRAAISRYSSGDDYHRVIEGKLKSLLGRIEDLAPGSNGRVYVDTGPVMEKVWAARSGIGWVGKNSNLIANKRLGSWLFLGEILLDLELEYDQPSRDHCGSCTRCIQSCPTEAIVEPYVVDSRRCISYLTIEMRGDIEEELRPGLGNLVFGCDICQDVCPWNTRTLTSSAPEFEPRERFVAPHLKDLARMTLDEFRQATIRSPIKRAKFEGLLRNVAIAMGNSGDPDMVGPLEELLNAESPVVRRHAGWSLSQIGNEDAFGALRSHLEVEDDEETHRYLSRLPGGRPVS